MLMMLKFSPTLLLLLLSTRLNTGDGAAAADADELAMAETLVGWLRKLACENIEFLFSQPARKTKIPLYFRARHRTDTITTRVKIPRNHAKWAYSNPSARKSIWRRP
jgi:hypothetical protein